MLVHEQVCGSIKPAQCSDMDRKWQGKDASQEKGSWQTGILSAKNAFAETLKCAGSNVNKPQDRDIQGSKSAEDDHSKKSMSKVPSLHKTESTQTFKVADGSSAPMKRSHQCRCPQDNCNTHDLVDINVDLVCIDFGSMGSMGLLGNAKHFVEILALALKQAGVCGVLLTGVITATLDSAGPSS